MSEGRLLFQHHHYSYSYIHHQYSLLLRVIAVMSCLYRYVYDQRNISTAIYPEEYLDGKVMSFYREEYLDGNAVTFLPALTQGAAPQLIPHILSILR